MLRTTWSYSAKGAVEYLSQADYLSTSPGELLGKGFQNLNIDGMSARDVFECLCHNVDPKTGALLRPHMKEGDRVGMDFTFNATKSVSLARELAGPDNKGDPRIEAAHREAVAYALSFIERDMKTRVKGGREGDRVTGNLMAYRVTHRDTRINPDDQMPDPSLHDHVFVLNTTFDPVERKWKAAQMGDIKHDAPYYEAIYHNRLAHNLRALGYGIRREGKAFEIEGIDRKLITKFSRRTAQIEATAKRLGIKSEAGKAKLGATTRMGKTKEVADDLNAYYVSRLTDREKQQLADLEGQPSYLSSDEKAVRYAAGHLFERQSVVEERKLYETAIRHGIGSVTPEGIEAESRKQGVLVKAGEATTKAVLAEESRIIQFAREGRGTCRPMGRGPDATPALLFALEAPERHGDQSASESARGAGLLSPPPRPQPDLATLPDPGQEKGRPDESIRPIGQLVPRAQGQTATPSPTLSTDQARVVRHVLTSTDRVILVRGAAGTGKTTTTKAIVSGIDRPYAMLAPSSEASRGVLRREGFDANTVAAFLGDQKWQARMRGGVLFVDEAGLLPIRDLARLTDVAREQNARIVLMGDPKQHKAVARHGSMFHVLQQFAGLPVAELRDIKRQKGEYKEAVAAIDKGDLVKAHDLLEGLGYIRQVTDNNPLVEDYLQALAQKKSVLIVAPTHKEGSEITAAIRGRLKEEGKLKDDVAVFQLAPQNWTDAEKADPLRYEGTEIVQFFRNSGPFRAGQRVAANALLPHLERCRPGHFAVYHPGSVAVAAGDRIRITANGKTADGHRVDNGAGYTVDSVARDGRVTLNNGWILPPGFGHIAHGYVSTSYGSQGKTVDVVLAAMGRESLPAMSSEQFYVTASRGRERFTLYTDLERDELREATHRQDGRKSATELMTPDIKQIFYKRRLELYRRMREERIQESELTQERRRNHGR